MARVVKLLAAGLTIALLTAFSSSVTVSVNVVSSTDPQADMAKVVSVLKGLGFTSAAVSQFAPKGARGFRAYPGQFTVVAAEADKRRVTISFSEGADKFSSRAKTTYADMVRSLRTQFGAARVEDLGISASE